MTIPNNRDRRLDHRRFAPEVQLGERVAAIRDELEHDPNEQSRQVVQLARAERLTNRRLS